MSSKAIIFTPEKKGKKPQRLSAAYRKEGEAKSSLRRPQAEVLLGTTQPEHRPAGSVLTGSGMEVAGRWGVGHRTRRKILATRIRCGPLRLALIGGTLWVSPKTTPSIAPPLLGLPPFCCPSRPPHPPCPWLCPLNLQVHFASTSSRDLLPGTLPPSLPLRCLLSVPRLQPPHHSLPGTSPLLPFPTLL